MSGELAHIVCPRKIGKKRHGEYPVKRKSVRSGEGVQIIATSKIGHGFQGRLALCARDPPESKSAAAPTVTSAEDFVRRRAENGDAEAMEFMKQILKVPPSEVSVAGSTGSPGISTITASSSEDTISQDNTGSNATSEDAAVAETSSPIRPVRRVGGKTAVQLEKMKPSGKKKSKPKKSAAAPKATKRKGDRAATPRKNKKQKSSEPPSTPTIPTPSTPQRTTGGASFIMSNGKKRVLKPGELSPERMKNGRWAVGCDHDNLDELLSYERNFFSAKIMAEKENEAGFPKCCVVCQRSFHPKGDNLCVINRENPVRACRNAYNHIDYFCTFAMCNACWVTEQEKVNGSQRRSRSRK